MILACAAAGCGGSAPPPRSPTATGAAVPGAPAAPKSVEAAPKSVEAAPGEREPSPSSTGPGEDEASAAAAGSAPREEPRGRTINYRVTPSGLVIELEGLRLEPNAKPVKIAGGWGVKLTVRVHATDDHLHRFLSPDGGPLMVAAEIDRGGGKTERIADERKGDTETFVTAGDQTPLEREFKKPITAGQSLTLHVGLWGLGRDADDRKPIRKLFVVKMVAGHGTPQPTITPPG